MAAIITLDDVSVTFHEAGHTIEAVKHASLEVEQGEIFGIVGFSGAGNTGTGGAGILPDLYQKVDGSRLLPE